MVTVMTKTTITTTATSGGSKSSTKGRIINNSPTNISEGDQSADFSGAGMTVGGSGTVLSEKRRKSNSHSAGGGGNSRKRESIEGRTSNHYPTNQPPLIQAPMTQGSYSQDSDGSSRQVSISPMENSNNGVGGGEGGGGTNEGVEVVEINSEKQPVMTEEQKTHLDILKGMFGENKTGREVMEALARNGWDFTKAMEHLFE